MNEIITQLYEKHIPHKIFKKLIHYSKWDLLDDFCQQMFVELLNISPDKIHKLYIDNELDNYFAKICLNQLINPKSPFNKMYDTKTLKIPIDEIENTL